VRSARITSDSYSAKGIAGTHVVLLGMDIADSARDGLLGFAIERTDLDENEHYYLKGIKTFAETDPGFPPGTLVSTAEHPIQGFLWGDYTAKPGHRYEYRISALKGSPKNLRTDGQVVVPVKAEDEVGSGGVFFNRGVLGSQAYARRFNNADPREVPNGEAFKWLSRGLLEALLSFIARATGEGWALRGAFYEFQYGDVLDAFRQAADRGVDVKLVYDARENSKMDPVEKNRSAIKTAGISNLMIPRTENPSFIAHNKFVVLSHQDVPLAVWTGSTNITESGIFGQSNVGFIVEDANIAQQYHKFWEQVAKDPVAKELRLWTDKETPTPTGEPPIGITPIFSPRGDLSALQWYADRMDAAKSLVCFTAAFGITQVISEVLGAKRNYLRYVLVEKSDETVDLLRRVPTDRVSVGSFLGKGGPLAKWLSDRMLIEHENPLGTHVKYVHDKFMLVDPLSEDPVVITGSANFSPNSVTNSDENMLVYRRNTTVADIYLGEFMRVFNQFFFRYLVEKEQQGSNGDSHLTTDGSWTDDYFVDGSAKQLERKLFSGST
jgi:phosphatidylserine/phosphatidylglycerophosphate/cardiolipin synthase-like enzyme